MDVGSGSLSDEDRDHLISQFSGITGSESDQSHAYLESTGWNLDLAIQSFYEEAEEQSEARAQLLSSLPVQSPVLEASPESPASPVASADMSGNKKKPAPRTGIATLSSLRRENESPGSESDDDNNQQAFYAGGSDRSGQQILGPKDKKKDPQQLVKEMFQSAREHGGQVLDELGPTAGPSRLFSGAGFRLGDDVSQESQPVTGTPGEPQPAVPMVLKMWRNGFSVDDGPLRSYRDPENANFLSSIRRGEIPDELLALAHGGEVNLNMEDHQAEEYVPVKQPVRAFGGEGHRLGNVTPAVTVPVPTGDPKENAAAAQAQLNVDESKPVTSVQIRLSDGSRLVPLSCSS